MFAIQQVSTPRYEPITRAQAKKWLRIDDDITVDDAVVDALIKAVRELAENLTFRCFAARQFKLILPCWPTDREWGIKFVLPNPPLRSVESIKYIDINGTQQTLSSSLYDVHAEYTPGIVIPAINAVLPSIRTVPNALEVIFNAGYAPTSPDDENGHQEVLPEALKLWMKTKISTMHGLREQVIVGTNIMEVPRSHVDGLLDALVTGDRLF